MKRHSLFTICVVLALAASLIGTPPVSAQTMPAITRLATGLKQGLAAEAINEDTIVVNTLNYELNADGDCSLPEAITAANTNAAEDGCAAGIPGADTITFSVTGTVVVGMPLFSDSSMPTITEDLTIAGPSAANLIVTNWSGPDVQFRLFEVDAGVTLSLQRLTITATHGIRNSGTLVVSNSTFAGNKSPFNTNGGAIQGGTVTVESSSFSGNQHGVLVCTAGSFCGQGGAIDAGSVTVANSFFTGNGADAYGGAIFANTVIVTKSTFSNNGAEMGGAIYIDGGGLSLSNSILSNNRAAADGGAIFNHRGISLDVTGSTFSDNRASSARAGNNGGAIYNDNARSITISNSIFSNNQADNYGGAIDVVETEMRLSSLIVDSTFSGNQAESGGAIASHSNRDFAFESTILNSTFSGNSANIGSGLFSSDLRVTRLRNTIIANGFRGNNCYGGIIDEGHNLQHGSPSNDSCGESIPIADPLLGPLADNGGPTLTHALLPGSAAIDAIPLVDCMDNDGEPIGSDQRGVPRPQDGNGDGSALCDIGAFEYGDTTPPTVLSIMRVDANPTKASHVGFTVTFSETVSGVDTSDFNLRATSDITGARLTSVSGAGSTYLVTVNTGSYKSPNAGLIDINSATASQLDTLPGIGPTIAQRIIDYRTLNGPFFQIEEIMNVSGIGPGTFQIIRDLITVCGPFLRLDVVDDDTIRNGNNIPLGGPGLGNGNFSSGEVYTITKSEITLPTGWMGGVSISSDKLIVAVGRPHIGEEVASYDGFASGSLISFVPMLFKNAWGSYDSALYVQNVHETNTAHVTIKYYDNNGLLNCTKTDMILPMTSRGYWVPSATCDSGSLPDGWAGGAVVISDQPIVAVGRPHIGGEVMTYNGFTATDVSLSSYIPMLFKSAFGGSYNAAFYVQNTNENNAADITIKFYDNNGALKCTKADTIQPFASRGYWVPSVTCDSGSLPDGWVGGAVVTSDQPIVGVGRPHIGSQVTTYNGFTGGIPTSFIPMLFKNAWGSYDSAFYLQNTHASSTANFTIQYYDSDGNLSCTKTDRIAPLASKGYWVPIETCDSGSLPDGWVGGVVVTSDQPIVGVGRPHIGTQVTTYNGFKGGTKTSYLPMLFKQAFGGSYDSAFYIQNTENTSAIVTVKFHDTNGNLICTRQDTIAPQATQGYWVPSVTCTP